MDFLDKYPDVDDIVDYSTRASQAMAILPLPKSRDNLEVIADKIEALAQVVAAHQNLAIRTGRAGADAVTIAKRSMTREQKVMYETWEQGLRMPAMDWKKNRKPVPANASDSGLYWTFALGIDHIWDHVGTTAENAAYVVSTWPQSLSLILVGAAVIKAACDMVN